MDRRSFLQLLGAVGVLAGGATAWLSDLRTLEALAPGLVLPDADISPWLKPDELAVYGRQRTFQVSVTNSSEHIGLVFLKRFPAEGGHTLLDLSLGPGGIVQWVAARGEEIYGPIRIVAPEIVDVRVIGTDNRGRVVMATKDGVVPLLAE